MCGAPPRQMHQTPAPEVFLPQPPTRDGNAVPAIETWDRLPEQFGRYRVLKRIGRGGMAVVYLASSRLAGHVNGQVLHVAGGMEGRILYDPGEIDLTKA